MVNGFEQRVTSRKNLLVVVVVLVAVLLPLTGEYSMKLNHFLLLPLARCLLHCSIIYPKTTNITRLNTSDAASIVAAMNGSIK